MFQLFQNLIGNALKYHSGESAEIHVSGKEDNNHFIFSVKDNGIGIKPVFFEKIFILFNDFITRMNIVEQALTGCL